MPRPRHRIVTTCLFAALIAGGLSVPARAADIPSLQTAMTSLPPPRPSTVTAQAVTVAPFPLADTFKLHSAPGAQRVIYLDFNGETISGTAWNNSTTGSAFNAVAFDTDGNSSTFSEAELGIIQETWQRVAEDFAPLAVDVTTEDPGLAAIDRVGAGDLNFGTRALITDTSIIADSCGCSGVAYVGSLPLDNGHQYYQPAFIFGKTLGTSAKDLADVVSHEVGHNAGLDHDGNASSDYYGGQGVWAPIMGMGYNRGLTQFDKGEFSGAENTQADFTVMGQHGLPLRADDHGDTTAAASPLNAGATGSGVISTDADVDVFSVTAPGGAVSFTANPAPKGPNLDIKLELLDGSGGVVAANDPLSAQPGSNPDYVTGLSASVNASVAAGTYFLRVQGVGAGNPATTGYSGYGSLGAYTLTGSSGGGGGTPALSVGDVAVSEGNAGSTNVIFTVSLSAAAAAPVSVNAGTANGTALAGTDYTGASGVVTIPAGQTSAAFTVIAAGDILPEPHEKFSLVLSNPTGATIADATGAATLVNDDGVGMAVSDVAKFEGGSGTTTTFTFTVTLSTVPSTTIGVTVKTANGTALSTSDYTAKTQLLSFAPGQKTKTFTVTVKGDATKEPSEVFSVNLSAPTGSGAKVTDAQGVGTIRSDD